MKTCTRCNREHDTPWRRCPRCRETQTACNRRLRGCKPKKPGKVQPVYHGPDHCECGRGRKVPVPGVPPALYACRACQAMDGSGTRQFDVIQTLRSAEGPLSTEALSYELGISSNTVQVMLARLIRKGLVGKRTLEPYGGALEWKWGTQVEYYVERMGGKR